MPPDINRTGASIDCKIWPTNDSHRCFLHFSMLPGGGQSAVQGALNRSDIPPVDLSGVAQSGAGVSNASGDLRLSGGGGALLQLAIKRNVAVWLLLGLKVTQRGVGYPVGGHLSGGTLDGAP